MHLTRLSIDTRFATHARIRKDRNPSIIVVKCSHLDSSHWYRAQDREHDNAIDSRPSTTLTPVHAVVGAAATCIAVSGAESSPEPWTIGTIAVLGALGSHLGSIAAENQSQIMETKVRR